MNTSETNLWQTKGKTNRRTTIKSALALQALYLGWGKIDQSKWLSKNHNFINHSTRIPDKSVTQPTISEGYAPKWVAEGVFHH
jgi:hypothetical protein